MTVAEPEAAGAGRRAEHERLERLIARTAMADRAAFRDLYAATAPKLFAICLRILSDRAEAEDALQEVYVRIWSRAQTFRPGGRSPMTWLIAIARNHAIDRLRSRSSRAEDDAPLPELVDPAPDPEAETMAAELRGRIAACLDELPVERATAVRAAYLEGSTYRELAARFDVPLNTMRTWLRRSLQSLRRCLER